jgi:hypothetical protein
VQDTANDDTQAAGQSDASTNDDTAAEQALAAAMQQPETDQQAGSESRDDAKPQRQGQQQNNGSKDPWADADVARREIEKLRKEAAGWRTKYRDAEPQLSEYQKYLDSQKTEQQKLLEAKEAAERELGDLRSQNARLMAAATHNIPPELIDLLGAGTDEQIDERAKLLAEKLAAVLPSPVEPERRAPSQTRPVESLTAGAKPADDKPTDMDAVLRGWAGRG